MRKLAGVSEQTRTLTERRKAATSLEIARVAARLFADRGVAAVTADAIAGAAGVSLRTFYRYCRTKEDAIAPLLRIGGDGWRQQLARTSTADGLDAAVESAIRGALTPQGPDAEEGLRWARAVIRTFPANPALAEIWYRVNRESETLLVPLLADLAPEETSLEHQLVAAGATDAIRIALETWAGTDAPATGPAGPAELAVHCFRRLTGRR